MSMQSMFPSPSALRSPSAPRWERQNQNLLTAEAAEEHRELLEAVAGHPGVTNRKSFVFGMGHRGTPRPVSQTSAAEAAALSLPKRRPKGPFDFAQGRALLHP